MSPSPDDRQGRRSSAPVLRRRRLILALSPLLGLGLATVWLSLRLAPGSAGTAPLPTITGNGGPAAIGGPFELVDHTGRRVSEATFRGRLMLVYFGYSSCPDTCPTTLSGLSQALDLLGGPAAAQVAFLFITVDPARDQPARLAAFAPIFHPRLLALTGTEAECAHAARAYHVYRKVQPAPPDQRDYAVDHSSFTYLMGRDGRLITIFPQGTPPEEIASTIQEHL